MSRNKYSIGRQLGSFRHALNGIVFFFRNEPKAYVHLIFDAVIIVSGIVLDFSSMEWVILSVGMVILLATELLNTSIEELCDFVESDWHEKIKAIKDMSSGAVMLVALVVGLVYLYYAYKHMAAM